MYRILMAIDGDEHSERVTEETITIANGLNAEVTVLHVTGEYDIKNRISVHMSDDYWAQVKKNMQEEADKIVNKAAEKLKENGVKTETKVLIGKQSPADGICKMADRGDFNLLIVGSHRLKGVREMFLGSVSNKVAHCTVKNVLIVK